MYAAVLMSVYDHVTVNAQNYIIIMLDCLLVALKADSQQESYMKIPGSWNGLDGPELAGEFG